MLYRHPAAATGIDPRFRGAPRGAKLRPHGRRIARLPLTHSRGVWYRVGMMENFHPLDLETVDTLWTEVRPLAPADLQALAAQGAARSVDEVSEIRSRHHRVAKLLAAGKSGVEVARLSGFSLATVYRLRQSPAFENLVLHYIQEIDGSMDELFERMNVVSLQLLDELQDRLDSKKEMEDTEFKDLVKAFVDLADRIGYAPVVKTQQDHRIVDADFIREIKNASGGGAMLSPRGRPALLRQAAIAGIAGEREEV